MKEAGSVPTTFFGYFNYFRTYAGKRMYVLIGLTFLSSYLEGLGIALFYPLFNGGAGQGSSVSRGIESVFRLLHVPLTARGALPVIAGLFLLKGIFSLGATTLQFYLSADITQQLRERAVMALQRADYRYMLGTNTGFLTNLLINEIPRATAGFLYLTRVWPPIINIVVFVAVVVTIDWRLTLICVAMGGGAVLLMRLPTRMGKRYSALTTAQTGVLASLMIQTVQAFKYLRATAGFDRFRVRIDKVNRSLADAEYKTGVVLGLNAVLSQPVMVLFLAAILYYRLETQSGDLAPLFILLMYLFRIMAEVVALQSSWQVFASLTGSVDIVRDTLPIIEAKAELSGATPCTGIQEGVTCRALDFSYSPEKPPVLRQIDLSIAKNSAVAFVGESGSGKSTLVDLLSGTLKPTAGAVAVDGRDLGELDLHSYRKRIGYVSQESVVFDDSVFNNICLWEGDPSNAALARRVKDAAEQAQCAAFIQAMPAGYDAVLGERGVQLSGGQRQRIAIARELFKQPEILILDEATSALDSESEAALQRSIDGLKGKITLLMIAHRLSTVSNCDCVYVLGEGRIVESGVPAKLVAQPDSLFHRMWEMQRLTHGSI